ncbi:MAG: hypothetical protein JWN57_760 [Frankiales bacterium]|nr:hypothetical protein [Frankiales bacterium]
MALPTSVLSAGSLVAGYATGVATGQRPLAGVVLAAGGVLCTTLWRQEAGNGRAALLLGTYLGAFGVSHPLAKQIGAWPAVLTVAAATGLAAHVLADRGDRRVRV